MQSRMVLVLSVTVSLMACGGTPSVSASRLTNRITAATNSGLSRFDRRPNGSGWLVNSPIPEPLGVAQGATVASGDGSRIYHIGGITGAMTPTKKVWVYSPADDTWSEAADIPVSSGIRTFGAAVELNGFIYVFGGIDERGILDTTWIYDEAKDSWSPGTNMPGPRFGSAVGIDGTSIWVAGGGQSLSLGYEGGNLWQYDPVADAWPKETVISVSMGRTRGVLFPNGAFHRLGGGFDGVTHVGVNFHEHYTFSRPQIPFGVTDPAVGADGGRIYVVGGGGAAPRAPGHTQIFDTVSLTWSLGPEMPSGVDNTSGAIANGTFYVIGGYDGLTPVSVNYALPLSSFEAKEIVSTGPMIPDAFEAFDEGALRIERQLDGTGWAIHWPVPEAYGVAQGSTVASSDGSVIYHIGGWAGSGLYVSDRMRVYSPVDDTGDASAMRSPWWDVARIPVSRGMRSYGSAVELNGFIYLFGGLSGDISTSLEVLNTTWIYDEANDVWFRGANMPGFRLGSAVATDGSFFWVIGGLNNSFGPDHTVWRYDPKADAFSTGFRDMPRDLGRIHGAWLPNGTVHVFGGAGPTDNHLVYDTVADTWSFAPVVPRPVLDPATVTDGTLIYLAGATDAPFPRPPGPVQIFDPDTNTWSEGPVMPGPYGIDNTSGTIANGVFYVMGGAWGAGATDLINYSIPMSEIRGSTH